MATKKPKPPKTFQEVEDYIKLKKLNVPAKIFWDFFEAGNWYDSNGKPVLCWKQKLITWHGRDRKTVSARVDKHEIELYQQRIRDSYQDYLESKSTPALLDIKKDGGQLAGLCGWLIDEIIESR